MRSVVDIRHKVLTGWLTTARVNGVSALNCPAYASDAALSNRTRDEALNVHRRRPSV